jgi:uncharacterized lipoprotein NlpE involved in copper resistance
MRIKIITLIWAIGIIFYSCNSNSRANGKTLYIAAETKPCQAGVMQKECMQIKWKKDQKDWENFYDNIEGFIYEKGNEYELIINETKIDYPPADAPNIKYTLVKVVSKNKVETTKLKLEAQPFTSTHVFKAQYQGSIFHTCLGKTAMCPKDCGNSGNLASFKVLEYIDFIPNGEGGRAKLKTYQTQTSDYYKNDLDKPCVKEIKSLKEGDIVKIHVDYVYDTTQSTVGTIETLRSIITISDSISDTHNGKNSLDWAGTYQGVLPCADCDGIRYILTLKPNNTYHMAQMYLNKKNDAHKSDGKLIWDKSGNKITLEEKGDNNEEKQSFNVLENKLLALGRDGNIITGNLADRYILTKKLSR